MIDYTEQVERLRDWTALNTKNQPALTVGMMRSAAATLERMGAELARLHQENLRLNQENFWLSQNQREPIKKNMLELPPVGVGDSVFVIRKFGTDRRVGRARVCRMEIREGRVYLYAKGGGSGFFGEQVFGTQEDAENAQLRMLAELKKGVVFDD